MSAYTNLMGTIEASTNGYEAEYLIERGRGFASDIEGWGEIKRQMELLTAGSKDTEKLTKEMWEAIKEGNQDAFSAFCGQLARNAKQIAAEWCRTSALAEIALGG